MIKSCFGKLSRCMYCRVRCCAARHARPSASCVWPCSYTHISSIHLSILICCSSIKSESIPYKGVVWLSTGRRPVMLSIAYDGAPLRCQPCPPIHYLPSASYPSPAFDISLDPARLFSSVNALFEPPSWCRCVQSYLMCPEPACCACGDAPSLLLWPLQSPSLHFPCPCTFRPV
jgi:hypothetical protein